MFRSNDYLLKWNFISKFYLDEINIVLYILFAMPSEKKNSNFIYQCQMVCVNTCILLWGIHMKTSFNAINAIYAILCLFTQVIKWVFRVIELPD